MVHLIPKNSLLHSYVIIVPILKCWKMLILRDEIIVVTSYPASLDRILFVKSSFVTFLGWLVFLYGSMIRDYQGVFQTHLQKEW